MQSRKPDLDFWAPVASWTSTWLRSTVGFEQKTLTNRAPDDPMIRTLIPCLVQEWRRPRRGSGQLRRLHAGPAHAESGEGDGRAQERQSRHCHPAEGTRLDEPSDGVGHMEVGEGECAQVRDELKRQRGVQDRRHVCISARLTREWGDTSSRGTHPSIRSLLGTCFMLNHRIQPIHPPPSFPTVRRRSRASGRHRPRPKGTPGLDELRVPDIVARR